MISNSTKIIKNIEIQEQNKRWWNQNPMNYDWHKTLAPMEGSTEFFAEIDARHFTSSPFYQGNRPLAELIPFDKLTGKCVLEIGCGLGSHTQLLSEAGCQVTAIDITERAVELTSKRLLHRGLHAVMRVMDAEQMEFENETFDFVWSWGVIHHSANTEQIIKEVRRVLKVGGEFRFMVYNRHSLDSLVKVSRGLITGKFFKGMSISDVLNFYSDGYIAKHYTAQQLSELLNQCGFKVKKVSLMGQKSELVPIPGKGLIGYAKYALISVIPNFLAKKALSLVGWFIFVIAEKPSE